ncbi:MAG: protein kinase [Candidatus Accumulibacter sp.]|uniref:Protein kinase n=1 Tax=Candidatus Accumulibacter proximus TaxID=2954385 RepID=A0A935UGB8_9PROT|nr:protein kinase [Candidatus Accumulibacter proximus]
MNDMSERCPACCEPKSEVTPCACGYDPAAEISQFVLSPGTRLVSKEGAPEYQIGRVLGIGGFSVTYLAWDLTSSRKVAIKEFMPRENVYREASGAGVRPYDKGDQPVFEQGLERFLREARALSEFNHSNVVSVTDFFKANGTAYLVMPYYEGKTLGKYLEQRHHMPPDVAVRVMLSVLDGLKHIHSRTLDGKRWMHRDVTPYNIFLREAMTPLLIDFGSARVERTDRSNTASVVLTPGYAPFEQYVVAEDGQGPWVDVYGCAATLYHALTGEPPADAPERHYAVKDGKDDPLVPLEKMVPGIDLTVARAVVSGLAIDHRSRPQSAEEFQQILMGKRPPPKPADRLSTIEHAEPGPGAQPGLRRPQLWIAGVLLLVAAAAGLGIYVVQQQAEIARLGSGASTPSVQTTTPPPVPAPAPAPVAAPSGDIEKQMEQTQQENRTLQQKIASLEADKARVTDERDQAGKDLTRARNELLKKTQEVKKLDTTLSEARGEVAQKNTENSQLRAQISKAPSQFMIYKRILYDLNSCQAKAGQTLRANSFVPQKNEAGDYFGSKSGSTAAIVCGVFSVTIAGSARDAADAAELKSALLKPFQE